jgi:hypothetical protein
LFPVNVTGFDLEPARDHREGVFQDLAEPGDQLGRRVASKLAEFFMGPK